MRRKRKGEGGKRSTGRHVGFSNFARKCSTTRAKTYRVLLPLRHLVNKRSELSRSRRMLPRTISFSVRLTPVARPQPTPIYPVALQLMCSRVEPCPSASLTYPPQFQFSFYRPPSAVSPREPTELGISASPPRERTFLSLSLSLSRYLRFPPFSLPFSFSLSLSLSLPLSFASPPLSVLRSAALFVLEIRRGLPDPLFSCAVINYYLLAIHPRTRYPRRGCVGGN